MAEASSPVARPALACRSCGTPAPAATAWRCRCGEPFALLDGADAEAVHLAGLPSPDLGQGQTPLIRAPFEGPGDLYLKLESANPSGSFKDRGMAVLVGLAVEIGASEIVCDSSGNAAAAVAAFAAAAAIDCRVFVPAGTPQAKLQQIAAYGAEAIAVPGDREAAARTAQAAAGRSFYASHYWHPYFTLGTRSFAQELVQQLSGRLPDHIVFPVGHGSLYLGAVADLVATARDRGVAAPRCHLVQARACAPVVAAAAGAQTAPAVGTTVAEGIRIPAPLRLPEILAALAATRGRAVAAEEAAIRRWWQASARRGVLMEPTSAAALAGLEALRNEGVIGDRETVVVPVTGHGLKRLPGPT